MARKPTKIELAKILGVSTEHFHDKIKPKIKREFRTDLQRQDIHNPDIWLDDNDKIILVKPGETDKFIETNLSIYSYSIN